MPLPRVDNHQHPITAIIGGMPGPDRLGLLQSLASQVDYLVLGGALANLFLSGQADDDLALLTDAECELILPMDVVVAQAPEEGVRARTVPVSHIPAGLTPYDLGTDSIGEIARCLEGSKTLIWHGPLGVCETPPFDNATLIVARHAAMLVRAGRLKCQMSGESQKAVLTNIEWPDLTSE